METLTEDIINSFLKRNSDFLIKNDQSNGDGITGRGYGGGSAICSGNNSGLFNTFYIEDKPQKALKEFNGEKVYTLSETSLGDIYFILKEIKLNIASIYLIREDLTLKQAYLCKVGNAFGCAETIEEATKIAKDIAIKWECANCVADFADYVVTKYPDVDALYNNKELLELHNIITGSCSLGRDEFIRDNHIDLNGQTTMRDFLTRVKYLYGSDNIYKVASKYGIEI